MEFSETSPAVSPSHPHSVSPSSSRRIPASAGASWGLRVCHTGIIPCHIPVPAAPPRAHSGTFFTAPRANVSQALPAVSTFPLSFPPGLHKAQGVRSSSRFSIKDTNAAKFLCFVFSFSLHQPGMSFEPGDPSSNHCHSPRSCSREPKPSCPGSFVPLPSKGSNQSTPSSSKLELQGRLKRTCLYHITTDLPEEL